MEPSIASTPVLEVNIKNLFERVFKYTNYSFALLLIRTKKQIIRKFKSDQIIIKILPPKSMEVRSSENYLLRIIFFTEEKLFPSIPFASIFAK